VPGIWMGGDGPAVDSTGNVYFATGDGMFDYNLGGLDYGDTLMKVSLQNGSFDLIDYFTPYNQSDLDDNDLDLGSSGPVLLPAQPGPNPNLAVIAGKGGEIYLVNQDGLGGYNSAVDQVVQEVPFDENNTFPEIFGGATYWNQFVYFGAGGSPIEAFSLSNGLLSSTPALTTPKNYNISSLFSISANGQQNGILWALQQIYNGSTGTGSYLEAFNASSLTPLYSALLNPSTHLAFPMVANGKVYVGTQNNMTVFGLLPKIQPTLGSGQTGAAGTQLRVALCVAVGNVYTRQGAAGVTVNFSDGGKGGTFSNPSPVTNSQGIALTSYTLPPTAGGVVISVTSKGYVTGYFTETATGGSGDAQ